MPRPEAPLHGSGPRIELARELRRLREAAGLPGYRDLGATLFMDPTTLSRATSARGRCPTWEVVQALGRELGGDLPRLYELWRRASGGDDGTDGPAPDGPHPPGGPHPPSGPGGASGRSPATAPGPGGPQQGEPGGRPPGRPLSPLPDDLDEPARALAAVLRQLKEQTGLTNADLARRIDYSPATISRAASGKTVPTYDVFRRYVLACGGDLEGLRPLWDRAAEVSAAAELAGLDEEPDDVATGPLVGDADESAAGDPAASTSVGRADDPSDPREVTTEQPAEHDPPRSPAGRVPSSTRRRWAEVVVAIVASLLVAAGLALVVPAQVGSPDSPPGPASIIDTAVVASSAPFRRLYVVDGYVPGTTGSSGYVFRWNTCDTLQVTFSVDAEQDRPYLLTLRADPRLPPSESRLSRSPIVPDERFRRSPTAVPHSIQSASPAAPFVLVDLASGTSRDSRLMTPSRGERIELPAVDNGTVSMSATRAERDVTCYSTDLTVS